MSGHPVSIPELILTNALSYSRVPGSLPKWTSPSLNLFCGGKKLPQIWNGDKDFCNLPLWNFTPFCKSGNAPCPKPPVVPPPSGPTCVNQYEQTQSNYTTTPTTGVYAGVPGTGAAASDPSYMTYGLVKSNAECIAMCEKTSGCVYVNVYQDQFPPGEIPQDLINQGLGPKYEVGTLTCSLFSKCLGNSAFTNVGGQSDPNYLSQSYGFCKDQACAGKN